MNTSNIEIIHPTVIRFQDVDQLPPHQSSTLTFEFEFCLTQFFSKKDSLLCFFLIVGLKVLIVCLKVIIFGLRVLIFYLKVLMTPDD